MTQDNKLLVDHQDHNRELNFPGYKLAEVLGI